MEQSKVHMITSEELKKFQESHKEKDYIIIDVRQPAEYTQGHIPGAKLIPLPTLGQRVTELPVDRDIVFYCRSGTCSMTAATFASDYDVSRGKIYNLKGGIMAYNGQKLPDFPRLQTFGNAKTHADLLIQSMELEKGARLFYTHIKDKFSSEPFASVFEQIADQETGHARTIYNYLKKEKDDIQSFENFFEELKGDIIESGEDLTSMFARVDSLEGSPCINLIEMSLIIENSAYDLHRTIAEQIDKDDIKEVFFRLAQLEKSHMQTIANSLEKCS